VKESASSYLANLRVIGQKKAAARKAGFGPNICRRASFARSPASPNNDRFKSYHCHGCRAAGFLDTGSTSPSCAHLPLSVGTGPVSSWNMSMMSWARPGSSPGRRTARREPVKNKSTNSRPCSLGFVGEPGMNVSKKLRTFSLMGGGPGWKAPTTCDGHRCSPLSRRLDDQWQHILRSVLLVDRIEERVVTTNAIWS
jgi:hypothetical protein